MYSNPTLPDAISHRGLHAALPENSVPAFLAAIDTGAEGIELDVHASSDRILFVHHDSHVIGAGAEGIVISEKTATEISMARLDGDVPVPTLDETIEAIGERARVFIEVKGLGIEDLVVRCLKRHGSKTDHHFVHAFDHRVVKRILERAPAVRTGILQVSYLIDTVAAMRLAGASDLWQHSDFIDEALVTDVHARGGRVVAWTPNEPAQWERLARAGVDAVCTDRVDAYVQWRAAFNR